MVREVSSLAWLGLVAAVAGGRSLTAQVADERFPSERRRGEVVYRSPADSTLLNATLVLPREPGPHPGVVLLSVADTRAFVDALAREGYAVLSPVRRGFVDVDPLLEATFQDLAGDVDAALDYLGGRPDVRGEEIALVAQAHDTPPAMLSVAASERVIPLVLLAPPVDPGVEEFRRAQLWLARRAGWSSRELAALDRYVERISEVVLSDELPYAKAYRLTQLRSRSTVGLPRNAEFPADQRQARFFASPLWSDRLRFEPGAVLSELRSPVLILVGDEEANTPVVEYMDAVRRALAGAPTRDGTVCLLPGRTRHAFTTQSIRAVTEWLDATRSHGTPSVCLDTGLR